MKEQTLAIPIDKIKSDFQLFLIPEHNRRIIFSGPFGIGKTYFLNEFFREETEYFPIFLRPVNYSLLTNEDIFKLIKYDILAELIKEKEFNIDDEFDFSKAEYLKFFLNENKFLILRNLLKAIPKIRNIVSVADDFGKLISKYKEGLDKINSDPSLEMLKQFQQDSENNFLLEYDEVSEYISSMLEEIAEAKKQREEKPQKVLIIDDLDRLDPEHIFRLFNVFSAHFDQVHYYENKKDNDNKFGFDKIIFVCDIENIRKIFAHKYGAEVDFSGYIDKFYSTQVFNLIHKNVFESILQFTDKQINLVDNDNRRIEFRNYFKFVLRIMFEGNQLNIREIIRISQFLPREQFKSYIRNSIILTSKKGARYNAFLHDYPILVTILIFKEIIGDDELLKYKLKKGYLKYINNDDSNTSFDFNEILPQLILFSDMDNHTFNSRILDSNGTFIYELLIDGQLIKYKLVGDYYNKSIRRNEGWFRIDLEKPQMEISNGMFYNILYTGIVKVLSSGII